VNIVQSIKLGFTEGSSDKEYFVQIEDDGDGTFSVNAFFGRRGGTMKLAPQGKGLTAAAAQKLFTTTVNKKTAKGYKQESSTSSTASNAGLATVRERTDTGMRPQLLNPIDKSDADRFLADDAYGLQIKYDGERLLIGKNSAGVTAANRKGMTTTIPGDLERAIGDIPGDFEIDGELVAGTYFVFDILWMPGEAIAKCPYDERYEALAELLAGCDPKVVLVELHRGAVAKAAAYADAQAKRLEGVVFKQLSAPVSAGRPASGGTQLKLKFWESATCIVAAINTQASIALALIDSGLKVPVGNVTVKPNQTVPKPGDVVEVKYLYMRNAGGALYQPELLAIRNDVDPEECTIDQIKLRG